MLSEVASLKEIKEAEADVRAKREAARAEAQRIGEDAARRAGDIEAEGRRRADEEAARLLDAARAEASGDRKVVLSRGEAAAADVKGRSRGRAFQEAVDAVLRRFEERLAGK